MSKRKERKRAWWASRTPEQKARIEKRRTLQQERHERDRMIRARRDAADRLGETAKVGDWLHYQADGGFLSLRNKICRIKDWDDDGYNDQRAGRNKRIIVEIEPHTYDQPKTLQTNFYGFSAVSELEVLAWTAE